MRIFNVDHRDNIYFNKLYDIIGYPKLTSGLSCGIQDRIHIRMGDLLIIPCHRTSYPEMIYGKIEGDGNVIVNNLAMALNIYSMNPNVSHPKCSDCELKYICMKGCLGSQYENKADIMQPCESVCAMLHAKYMAIYDICCENGLFDIVYQMDISEKEKERIRYIEQILWEVKQNYKK